jgi:hypothetical protein
MAEGGKVHCDPVAFGSLLNSALPLRRILGTASSVVVPIIAWMLLKSSAPVPLTAALILTLLAGFYYSLVGGVLQVVPRLLSQVAFWSCGSPSWGKCNRPRTFSWAQALVV